MLQFLAHLFFRPFVLNAKLEFVLMGLVFGLTIYNTMMALSAWRPSSPWVLLLAPPLGWAAVMLGVLVLTWLRSRWWRWWNLRQAAKGMVEE